MSSNTIPIRPPAFSQSHPHVTTTNNHQYNASFPQINHSHSHNHNHNHHHVHYSNPIHPKPFSSNKNNIPPLKTRGTHAHTSPAMAANAHPSNIYRNNTAIQSLRRHPRHPHPRIIPSCHPRPYPAVTNPNNFMHSYQPHPPQQQNPTNIYNKYHRNNSSHHAPNTAPSSLPNNNGVSFPKEHHFKAPAASNFVHQSQSQSQAHIASRESLFGNVIIDGPVKAPSPIGLETIVSSVPSINSQETSNSPSTHTFMPHANSQHINKAPFSYQANHTLTHCNTTRKRKRLSECINPVEMSSRPYTNASNSMPNQRYNTPQSQSQSQSHHHTQMQHSLPSPQRQPPPQSQAHTVHMPPMMQPPCKKRKLVNNYAAQAQFMPHTPQSIQQHIQSTAAHSIHAPPNRKHSHHHQNTMRQTNPYHTRNNHMTLVNNNNNDIVPSINSYSHHSSTANSANSNLSHPTMKHNKPTPNVKRTPKPPKPPAPKPPAVCTRRKKQNKKNAHPKKKKQLRKPPSHRKPVAKLCAEPRNMNGRPFRLKATQSANSKHVNEDRSCRIIPKRRVKPPAPSPVLHPKLSAGELAPALMPMPSISGSNTDKERDAMHLNHNCNRLPSLQPFPLYPQGPMMPPSPLGAMPVAMNGSPLSLGTLPGQALSPASPNTVPYPMHYTPQYNANFDSYHSYDSRSPPPPPHDDNDYMVRDLKANIVDIPMHHHSPFVISDDNTNHNKSEETLIHFVDNGEESEDEDEGIRRVQSVDLFDEREYDEYKEKKNELRVKMGWKEEEKEDNNFMDSLPLFQTQTTQKKEMATTLKLKLQKKAALRALYDVDSLEVMDPEVTRLRLVMNEDCDRNQYCEDETSTNRDALCLFTSSLIGSVSHDKRTPNALCVPQKHYIAHNEYNLTHEMSSKRLHEKWKIKMSQETQDAVRNKLIAEWSANEVSILSRYRNEEEEETINAHAMEEEEEEEAKGEMMHMGPRIVTDWNEIRALGVAIPQYYLDPSKYTRQQLSDAGCFKEKCVIRDGGDREIEINFFIYIPGGDINGQLKTQSATYAPVVYEIGCDGTRECALCKRSGRQCVGIIDLLNDENDRIWSCQECKNAFRVGLKLNTRTKQYRLKEREKKCVLEKSRNSKKFKREKAKKEKCKEGKTNEAFCDAVKPFKPYIYNVADSDSQYVFRYFEETDLDVLNHLDMKMTAQLLGTDADSYGRGWLNKLTNPQRKTHHIWRTIACAELLDVDPDGNEENANNNKYHIVCENKKMESKPIAFAMYKHMKNDTNITKRYCELFWILVDNQHQRKGIASRLIDIMVNEAQREEKMTEFRLHVLKNNDAAIPLYKKLAFTKKGSKANYPKRNYESYRCVKML